MVVLFPVLSYVLPFIEHSNLCVEWVAKTIRVGGRTYVYIGSFRGQFLFSGIFCDSPMATFQGCWIKEVQL